MSKDSFKHNLEDSSLMFAVIFDPEGGLETFSGTQLLALSPDYDVTEPQRPSVRNFLRGGKVKKKKEPFAIFGSREPMYIDIRSSRLYEKCLRNSNFDPAADSSNTSVDVCLRSSLSTFKIDIFSGQTNRPSYSFRRRPLPNPLIHHLRNPPPEISHLAPSSLLLLYGILKQESGFLSTERPSLRPMATSSTSRQAHNQWILAKSPFLAKVRSC